MCMQVIAAKKSGQLSSLLQFTWSGSSFNASSIRFWAVDNVGYDIEIEHGDGTSQTLNVTTAFIGNSVHNYTDSLTVHTIKVRTVYQLKITLFQLVGSGWIGLIPTAIGQWTKIQYFTLSVANFSDINASVAKITDLIQASIESCSSFETVEISTGTSAKVPAGYLAFNSTSPIPTWKFEDCGLKGTTASDHIATNMSQIGNLDAQSVSLRLNDLGSLPTQIADIANLHSLDVRLNTNISTTLISDSINENQNFNLLRVKSCFQTTARINAFIDDLYTYITTNANTTIGANTHWNNCTIEADESNASPTGTYQAPSGFSLGVNNGTPASQKEKIYVLVNNYSLTITYN